MSCSASAIGSVACGKVRKSAPPRHGFDCLSADKATSLWFWLTRPQSQDATVHVQYHRTFRIKVLLQSKPFLILKMLTQPPSFIKILRRDVTTLKKACPYLTVHLKISTA